MRVAPRLRVHSGGYEQIAKLSIKELLFKPLPVPRRELYFISQRKLRLALVSSFACLLFYDVSKGIAGFINHCLFWQISQGLLDITEIFRSILYKIKLLWNGNGQFNKRGGLLQSTYEWDTKRFKSWTSFSLSQLQHIGVVFTLGPIRI